ncbi:MAG: acyl-CoA thioesterase [Desulfarculaceae bacterium]|nr:acyl-CoA thioesterase [Desulfarculaceae bacterium]MCF8047457.1 acyl-CoA thioesterase [Desulfarculaceae bacterium]MCF8064192.1 acyl-CoA thioesterase [Desulfarculaceae bacterium]MCF8098809.1 acyl-CoA thioesterase [Desulfarculaceae bacterium]MCF8123836.1 acyl-CoA thioesterase [Desulfarculaceae bacterium]
MESKRVSDSSVVMAVVMEPADANPAGNVHGGVIMKNIDSAAGVVALRHAAGNAVTASIDRLDFHNPVYVGELLFLKAGLNLVGKSSMEIGVRVEAENPRQGQVRHVASAYLTFVALDENKQPAPVPGLILETAAEQRRNGEAISRRNLRLAEKVREKQSRAKGKA